MPPLALALPDLHPSYDPLRKTLRFALRSRFDCGTSGAATFCGRSVAWDLPIAREQSMTDLTGLRRIATWLPFLCLLTIVVGSFTAPAALAQGVVKAKHGDWEVRCETPPGAAHEQCALLQSVAAEDRPNINLVVIVLKTADGKSKLLRVIAPLGVLLPSGLGLKIDNIDVGRAGFVRCLPTGCVAEVVMDDKLIGEMRNGHNATFIIFQTPEEGIGIPLALSGFGEGYDALP
jgi:invasion protein IalB